MLVEGAVSRAGWLHGWSPPGSHDSGLAGSIPGLEGVG